MPFMMITYFFENIASSSLFSISNYNYHLILIEITILLSSPFNFNVFFWKIVSLRLVRSDVTFDYWFCDDAIQPFCAGSQLTKINNFVKLILINVILI